ncbi:MAG: ATP-binding protein [Gemmatimonadetes bacterium]|nr:ATP-binding protein [Gemmatimonadota bacterium]
MGAVEARDLTTSYQRRILDDELDELLLGLAAVAIEGPKAVGKTATALQRAGTVHRLDDEVQREIARADTRRLLEGVPPILIDEWQRLPESWDLVRRSVDDDPSPNRFLLTGSASPVDPPTHSGAGRIVRVRMRPLSLAERGVEAPTVSLAALLGGRRPRVAGATRVSLRDYTDEILTSGFPAVSRLRGRALRAQMESYVERVVDREFQEVGYAVRNPDALRAWMRAYAAATATTATLETIRDAATAGEADKPSRSVVLAYRAALQRLWLLDPLSAWIPSRNQIARLARPDKHHLADPALAAVLLGLSAEALLSGDDAGLDIPRDGTLLGHLFESLVTQSVRVYAQAAEADVRHLRTDHGRHEVDLVVIRPDQRVVALEVKLARSVADDDVKHLLWLQEQIGADLLDAAVIHTGPEAYRRPDGIAVVPAALLGP